MSFSNVENPERTEKIPIQLPNGVIAKIEVAQAGGREDVMFGLKRFEDVGATIEGIAETLAAPIQKVAPSKATIKFGLEVEIEQGSLVAALVRGKGKTHLEVTLEWSKGTALTGQANSEENEQEEE